MKAVDISLMVGNPSWQVVYSIPQNIHLEKGRHGLYSKIVTAAGDVRERFGCYAWASPSTIFYVGSFSKDYQHGNHESNLAGRIHNYLQNHRLEANGRKNTNLMVFESINQALLSQEVNLHLFRFDFIDLGGTRIDFLNYSRDSQLVRALEHLLTCSYKRIGQCAWNRE